MNFKHSAFIENTPEMMEWLEGLGYKRFSDTDGDTLCTMHDGGYHLKNYKLGKTRFQVYLDMINPIDCRSNPDLFKAITAMRDDSDYMQWFIADNEMKHQDEESGRWEMTKWFVWNSKESMCTAGRKATLEELIEHFKK